MRSIPARQWALALFSALLQAVPFPLAGPVSVSRRMVCWVCLTPLLACLVSLSGKRAYLSAWQAAALGYGCGVAWYLTNCYWIYATMHHYGGLPEIAAAGVLLLFALYLGLYHALFALWVTWCRKSAGPKWALLTAPFAWTAVELLRARITGFPWDLLGYTQVDNLWVSSLATLTGVLGLSLLVAGVNAAWLLRAESPRKALRWAAPAVALVVVVSVEGMGRAYRVPPDEAGKWAVLLQDNLSVGEDRGRIPESKADLLESFAHWSLRPLESSPSSSSARKYRPAAPRTPPEIIAWAEAPTNFVSLDPEFRSAVSLLARAAQAPLVADAASADPSNDGGQKPKEYVSAAFFDRQGNYVGRYDKMHLVPFGEYVPFKPVFFFAGHLLDGLDFSPGTVRRNFITRDHDFGVFICYESVFGDEVREFAKAGAQVFVNLSDDGWYGDTSAPWEHLDMVRMRAIENRRWVLRATNTGVTGSIDSHGRIVARLPRHVRGALAVPFAYREGTTFYTRHGDWVGWLCLAVATSVLAGAWVRPAAFGAPTRRTR